jgi:hypothetical protein
MTDTQCQSVSGEEPNESCNIHLHLDKGASVKAQPALSTIWQQNLWAILWDDGILLPDNSSPQPLHIEPNHKVNMLFTAHGGGWSRERL